MRPDLYYRLRGLEIQLPPLRERAEDIPSLADFFLRAQGKGLTAAAQAVGGYPWPGNVRQLRSALRYAVAVCPGDRIDVQHLSLEASAPLNLRRADGAAAGNQGAPGRVTLEEAERQVIRQALAAHQGNRSRAAEALGIHRSTPRRKLPGLGLDDSRCRRMGFDFRIAPSISEFASPVSRW